MERAIQLRSDAQSESLDQRLKLGPYLRSWFSIFIGLAVANILTLTLAQSLMPPPNPFSLYADVLPGQPMSAAEKRSFLCTTRYVMESDSLEKHCYLQPATGDFVSIDVIVYQDVIRQTAFIMRDNAIKIGDLMGFLGKARIQGRHRGAYFFLSKDIDIIIARTSGPNERFSLYAPVWSISFSELG